MAGATSAGSSHMWNTHKNVYCTDALTHHHFFGTDALADARFRFWCDEDKDEDETEEKEAVHANGRRSIAQKYTVYHYTNTCASK